MRTFIAIELSEEIRDTLAQIQFHLKYAGADVKWVNKANIHLTLKFLGEIDEKKAKEIKSVLDTVAKETGKFEITLKDIGVFPKIDFPRVVWVGLDKGASESTGLAKKIDGKLSGIGFQKETRPFAAHLTIGRVRSSKNKTALKEKIQSYTPDPKPFKQRITSVILFQSTLTPKGPIYTKLYEARLS